MKNIEKNISNYNEEKFSIILNNSDSINKNQSINKCLYFFKNKISEIKSITNNSFLAYNNPTNTQNKKKVRNPGIDLMRLIGMYIIVMNHMLFIGNAFQKFHNTTYFN
jgi:hypothetical protein